MSEASQVVVVGVRFSRIGKNYYFNASHLPDIHIGDQIIVETSRGWQIGEVTEIKNEISPELKQNIKKVDRKATAADLVKKQELAIKEEEILSQCLQQQSKMNIHEIKLVTVELGFDEKSASILYTSPEDKEVKGLENYQRAIRAMLPQMRTDFHKIGPRDAAKFFGGLGACGLEMRCCSRLLSNFQSISIKMAKVQNVSLTPSDITGMCDRLRCCLGYEFTQYEEALQGLPKRNQRVLTPNGEGKVIDLIPLQKKALVELGGDGEKIFDIKDIQKIEGSQNIPRVLHPLSQHNSSRQQAKKDKMK